MGASGARGLLFCAAKRSSAFPADIPAGLRARVSRLGGFTRPFSGCRDATVQVRAQDGKRFVARGSELPARQKPNSAESGAWGRQPPPAKLLVARGSEPPARQKPSAAESGGVGAAALTCQEPHSQES
jgi:hypothetical protein